MIFDKQSWKKYAADFTIFDCAYGYEDRYIFLMYEKQESPHRDPLPRTRYLVVRTERPMDTRFYFMEFGDFEFARVSYGKSPETEFVSVDIGGKVYAYNPPRSAQESNHPNRHSGSDLLGVVTQVVRIGESIYTVGSPRRMHKRSEVNRWQDISADLKLPKDVDAPGKGLTYMWQSAAGFSENDIYAVGGEGDVFHFDGKQWRKLDFPSNELLFNVCCASDGNVYIGGNMGSLYVGRGDSWKKLTSGNQSVAWKDIAWFNNKLWCGSDYGLWELKKDQLLRADVPADVQLTSGAIDISPDGKYMLTAGPDGASLFDGKKWQVLFSRHDLED
jgi:hypothetical protein